MTPFFTQKTKYRKNQTANSGFTLVELLAVVAILLLVGLIAVFSLNKLRRTLRQHELDAKAQIIYVAARTALPSCAPRVRKPCVSTVLTIQALSFTRWNTTPDTWMRAPKTPTFIISL